MNIMNNPTLKEKVDIVANWIIEECDEPIKEVEWLLKKVFVEQVKWIDVSNEETMILTDAKIQTFNEDINELYGNLFKEKLTEKPIKIVRWRDGK